jgi:hypothetical protein
MVKGLLDMGGGRMKNATITFHYLVGIVGCGDYKSRAMLAWNKWCSLSVM